MIRHTRDQLSESSKRKMNEQLGGGMNMPPMGGAGGGKKPDIMAMLMKMLPMLLNKKGGAGGGLDIQSLLGGLGGMQEQLGGGMPPMGGGGKKPDIAMLMKILPQLMQSPEIKKKFEQMMSEGRMQEQFGGGGMPPMGGGGGKKPDIMAMLMKMLPMLLNKNGGGGGIGNMLSGLLGESLKNNPAGLIQLQNQVRGANILFDAMKEKDGGRYWSAMQEKVQETIHEADNLSNQIARRLNETRGTYIPCVNSGFLNLNETMQAQWLGVDPPPEGWTGIDWLDKLGQDVLDPIGKLVIDDIGGGIVDILSDIVTHIKSWTVLQWILFGSFFVGGASIVAILSYIGQGYGLEQIEGILGISIPSWVWDALQNL